MEPTAPRADRANQLAQFLAGRWRAHVVPVDATRRYILGRVTDATREPAVIERLWTAQPGADVGVALAPSRIVIIDADTKHGIDGRDTRYELEQRYGALPATPRISTPHHGEQDWLRLPQGCTLRSSASKLGAAVDVIAAGVGFASGAGRRWFVDALPSETPLAELPPAWLVAIPGILAWIVEGALACHTDGLKPPSIVSAATAAYRQEMDAVGQWFEECCERDSGARTPFKLLYNAYVEDLKADAFSKRAFAQELDRLGIHSHVVGGVKFRAGVRLRDDQQSRDDR